MPAFLFQKGGVDLSPGSRLGLGLGSGFAPCLEGMAGVTTWVLWPPLWEYKAQLPGQLQGRAGDSQALPGAPSATSVYPSLPLPAPSACWQKLAGKC